MDFSNSLITQVIADLSSANKENPQKVFPISAIETAVHKLETVKKRLIASTNE